MAISIKLKKRWDIYPTLQDVLTATQNLSVSPFGLTEDGLHDFRGIKLEYPDNSGYYVHQKLVASLCCADFSGSVWTNFILIADENGQLPTVSKCVFDESKFFNSLSSFSNIVFTDCSFHACTFKHFEFSGSLKNCRFTGIKKSNSKLDFTCHLIKDCLFEGTMRKIHFGGSSLENCTFKGTLYDCAFKGLNLLSDKRLWDFVSPDDVDNRFNCVDFSEAEVILCAFQLFCYLDRVKPSPQNCLVHATEEFFTELCRLIESQANNVDKFLDYADTFYRPFPDKPYRFAHHSDFAHEKEPDTIIFAQQLYDFVCQAAEATNCRVK